jgi:hypothetical protein
MVRRTTRASGSESVNSRWRDPRTGGEIRALRRRHNDAVTPVLLVSRMRVGAARTIAIARHQTRRLDRNRSPIAVHRGSSARAGVQVGSAGAIFLLAYATLQLLHAFGRDPAAVAALSPIPLYARFIASAVLAMPAGLTLGLPLGNRERCLRVMPALLAAAIALFVVTVVFFS